MGTELFIIAQPPRWIDLVHIQEDGTAIGFFGKKTPQQMEVEYGAPVLRCTKAEYMAIHGAAMRTAPVEVTRDEWHRALEVRPPRDRCCAHTVESFKVGDLLSGDIAIIYARWGDRFWMFRDNVTLSATKIADRIHALNVD